jgi:hypothetical protein
MIPHKKRRLNNINNNNVVDPAQTNSYDRVESIILCSDDGHTINNDSNVFQRQHTDEPPKVEPLVETADIQDLNITLIKHDNSQTEKTTVKPALTVSEECGSAVPIASDHTSVSVCSDSVSSRRPSDSTAVKEETTALRQVSELYPTATTATLASSSAPVLTLYDKLKQRRARQMEMKNQITQQQQQQQQPSKKTPERLTPPEPVSTPSQPKPSSPSSKASLLKRVQPGSRIAIYWDGEDAYFSGTVKKIREERKRPYFVVYDDGDREWMDLCSENFRIVKKKINKQKEEQADGSMADDHDETSTSRESSSKESSSSSLDEATNVFKTNLSRPKKRYRSKKRKQREMEMPLAVKKSPSWVEESVKRSDSDSETDEEELRDWAVKMFGAHPHLATTCNKGSQETLPQVPLCGIEDFHDRSHAKVHIPISEKVKRRRQKKLDGPALIDVAVPKKSSSQEKKEMAMKEEEETAKRRREANRPLTSAEIQAILRIEDDTPVDSSNYVRRSVRQPNRAALNTPGVRALVDKLRNNDTDMVVLKMKKYINDAGTPQIVIDAILDALEENTNCEALYIQVRFNLMARTGLNAAVVSNMLSLINLTELQ